jgi:cytochrome c oxidase cbb3-type subunit 2
MPPYAFLAKKPLAYSDVAQHLKTLRIVGTPYTDDDIANAVADVRAQANPDTVDPEAMETRYPRAVAANFDRNPQITEMDALVAYLQVLGTMVDTKSYQPTDGR